MGEKQKHPREEDLGADIVHSTYNTSAPRVLGPPSARQWVRHVWRDRFRKGG
jgi:hypothetical protein